ncbi:hypothetical protein, partial [Leclercia adecarboxylata]
MISVDIFKKFRNKKTKNNKSEINSGSTLNISLQQDNYLKDITYEQQYNIIKQSGLFDSEFYEKKYTDVSKRKLDPIRHFIRHGYKENRWPNEFFDPVYYKKAYSIEDGIIPLTHYIQTPQAILNRTSEKFDGSFYYYLHDDVRKA